MAEAARPSFWRAFRDLGLGAALARGREPDDATIAAARRANAAGRVEEASRLYRRLAAQGLPSAQHRLACAYDFGNGVAVNKTRAVRLYRLAAEGGLAEAMFDLGATFQVGDGVPADPEAARAWYARAADAGHVRAQNNLGMIYRDGVGLAPDPAAALRCFRAAAEAGNANAQFNLAQMIGEGEGCERDLAASAAWLRRAAAQRHLEAMFELGLLCLSEKVEGMAPSDGVSWFARAALSGHFRAMCVMSSLHDAGELVARDRARAFGWAMLALATHLERAEEDVPALVRAVPHLRAGMTEAEVEAGRRFVLKRGGLDDLLVLAHVFGRRLGDDLPGEPDEAEAEAWSWFAMDHGAGTRRYIGAVPRVVPDRPLIGRRLRRSLAGKRIFSEVGG